jgi:hypothetical protein
MRKYCDKINLDSEVIFKKAVFLHQKSGFFNVKSLCKLEKRLLGEKYND